MCVRAHVRACVFACVRACVNVRMRACMCIRIHTHVHASMACMHTHIRLCVYAYKHTCNCAPTHACKHTHTHIELDAIAMWSRKRSGHGQVCCTRPAKLDDELTQNKKFSKVIGIVYLLCMALERLGSYRYCIMFKHISKFSFTGSCHQTE